MAHDLDERAPSAAGPEGNDARPRDWSRLDSLMLALITLAAGLLRFIGLGDAKGQMFDEVYYAKDACLYAGKAASVCGIDSPENYVHPPLGKWFIAVGIKIFGHNEMGWRVASAVAGTITIVLVYLLARKLLRSTLGASLVASLMAFDFLAFVQSRVSMLDVFVPMFGVATFLFLTYDRDRLARGPSTPEGLFARPWRLAAGAAAGAATATKWSGVFFVAAAIVVTLAWETAARKRDGEGRAFRRALASEGLTVMALLVLVPALVYLASYVGRTDGSVLAVPWSEGSWFYNLVVEHKRALDFHIGLNARHPYESPAWSWILLKRPVAYYVAPDAPEGFIGTIGAFGNPLAWWGSIPAIAFVIGAWFRRRDFLRPEGLILAGLAFTYGPWLLLARGRSAVFVFYLLPVLPFMYLALAYGLLRLGRSIEARVAAATFMAATIGMFVFYYPILVGTVIEYDSWSKRIIFKSCDKPPGEPSTSTTTKTVGGRTRTKAIETTNRESLPPTGWCWL
ncbi:MAG: dolichyl-phosphate-mannose--protein mannosyltransferase [Actinomycetota bacterium]